MRPTGCCAIALVVILIAPALTRAQEPSAADKITITRQALCDGRITNSQCGQFIEYLCNLVPGMWSEKLYDGSFEGLTPYKFVFIRQTDFREKPWYPSGEVNRAKYSLDPERPVSGKVSQKIEVAEGAPCTVGLSQDGIFVDPAQPLVVACWMRQKGIAGPVQIRIHHELKTYSSCQMQPGAEWKRFEAQLVPSNREENATLSISFHGPGTLWLDNASLMPRQTAGGWRPDVLEALRVLHPGVIRFGGSALDDPNLGDFEWRDTIRDVDHREPFRAWGGLQPVGPGLEEIVQLMQAAGAQPLICVRVRNRTPQDAADQVQYFNGPPDTPMGKLRAANGHPQPYHIKYWQIGNEQGGVEYERRIADFCRAMKAADPQIKLLSSYPSPGVIRAAGQYLSYVCPHQYDCGNLAATAHELDAVRALLRDEHLDGKIRVAVTEWNTTAGDAGPTRARLWSLENALACARYQNLLHRNCDLVEIACRSNLCNSFCSGIIQTDDHRLFKTPTYYMQQLYATMAGEHPLKLHPGFAIDSVPDCSATISSDGKTIMLFAVNPTRDDVMRALDLSELPVGDQEISTWTLRDRDRASEPDAANGFADPQRIAVSLTVLRWRVP